MNILIPILGFDRAGGYRVLSEFANAWIRMGHTVDFLAPATSEPPYFPTQAGIRIVDRRGPVTDGVRPVSRPMTGVDNLYCLWRGLRALQRDYDVVLANHSFTAWPVWLSGVDKRRAFYYVQAYEPEYYRLENRTVNQLISAFSYRLPLKQVHNSNVYSQIPALAVDVVPFGIDLNKFTPRSPASPDDSRPFVIGCIGRREPAKGTGYILEAFERLAAAPDSPYRLRVAYGNLPEGWTHPQLDVVVPRDDVELAAFYRSLDVLVAAGITQHGAPHYPVLEAMASGVPVISTGYLPATPDNSWLVAPRDAQAIADAVIQVHKGGETTDRVDRGLQAVAAYAWDAVADRMIKVFEAR
jgi:glycosyltransferase involved in cell wall biosynthesis